MKSTILTRVRKGRIVAYNNQGQGQGGYKGNGGGNRPNGGGFQKNTGGNQTGGKKDFVEDPTKVGIGYERQTKDGRSYIAVTITKEVAEGTKLSLFLNDKVKNRTEKTPTHVLKISKSKVS